MITVFQKRTTVGLVRFYSAATAQAVSGLLMGADVEGFRFEASDVSAAPIFVDR